MVKFSSYISANVIFVLGVLLNAVEASLDPVTSGKAVLRNSTEDNSNSYKNSSRSSSHEKRDSASLSLLEPSGTKGDVDADKTFWWQGQWKDTHDSNGLQMVEGSGGGLMASDLEWGNGYGPDDEDSVFASGHERSHIAPGQDWNRQLPPAGNFDTGTIDNLGFDEIEGSAAGAIDQSASLPHSPVSTVPWWEVDSRVGANMHTTMPPWIQPVPRSGEGTTVGPQGAWWPRTTTTVAYAPYVPEKKPSYVVGEEHGIDTNRNQPDTSAQDPTYNNNGNGQSSYVPPVQTNNGNNDNIYDPVNTTGSSPLEAFMQPGILAAILGGIVVGLLAVITLVMFIVYRMRKKDEGSYALDEPKGAPPAYPYAYAKAPTKEFYA